MPPFATPLPAAPLAETDHAEILDALRGFALCGVCLANLFTGFALWDVLRFCFPDWAWAG